MVICHFTLTPPETGGCAMFEIRRYYFMEKKEFFLTKKRGDIF